MAYAQECSSNAQGYPNYSQNVPAYPPGDPGFNQPPNIGFPNLLPFEGNSDLQPYSEDAQPLVPSAPLDPLPGYPNVGFTDGFVDPPPSYENIDKYFPKQRPEIKGASVITEEEAKNALLDLCKTHRCWGSRAARDMNILNMKTTTAFQYTLESFCEKRTTMWACTPYTGYPIDGPNNGYPPGPWDIPLFCQEKFKPETRSVEVPHTACVKLCNTCLAKGYLQCTSCHGHGRSRCISCHGNGHTLMSRHAHHTPHHHGRHSAHHSGIQHRSTCFSCHGTGWKTCHWCNGCGRKQCTSCQGHCNLKWFIQLTVHWVNNQEHYVFKEINMPDELVKAAGGDVAFQEENVRVFPISHCPQPMINKASSDLISKHATAFPSDKIIAQRQTIKLVPITETDALWKNNEFKFFVYGLEKKAHTDNYPQTKCCGCSLM